MRITYDAEADAPYIYLQGKPGQAVDRTQELGNGSPSTTRAATWSSGSRSRMPASASGASRSRPSQIGPDFIDPGFHDLVTGRGASNLDGCMCGREHALATVGRHAADADLAIVDGVMGCFDGLDATSEEGSPSSGGWRSAVPTRRAGWASPGSRVENSWGYVYMGLCAPRSNFPRVCFARPRPAPRSAGRRSRPSSRGPSRQSSGKLMGEATLGPRSIFRFSARRGPLPSI